MTNFIDLHNHSTFSLLDGFGSPKAVVQRAKDLGWSAVSLTEHGTLMSAPALYKAARAEGIKPILGCEFYVTPDWAFGEKGKDLMSEQFHLTVLALSREGYENLVVWSTEAMQRENFYRKPRISVFRMAEIAPWPLHHNVILSGCIGGELCQSIKHNGGSLAADYILGMKSLFPNFYVEIQDHYASKFMDEVFPAYCQMIVEEAEVRERLVRLAAITHTPLVLTNDSHMQRASDRKAHVAMKASSWRSRDDQYISSERLSVEYLKDYTYFTNYMRQMEGMDAPPEAYASIAEIVEEADIRLDPLDNFSYSIPHSGYDDPMRRMRSRSKSRLQELIAKHGEKARERFEYEIESIGDFAHYLLLISDFIIAARGQGIITWTRGSAASSLLCYCLRIHEIDPIEHELIFSRFFNPARKKLPDIDIDIQPSRYEDFMRIVHEKMEPLVGKGQVEQICNYGTAANRSAFRMAASALGIEKEEQDEISKLLPQMIDSGMVDEDTDVFTALQEDYPDLYEIASSIFDSIKSISQHACAWAFGTPERPLKKWVPMYLIASSNTLVTQFDFKSLEDFGLVKGDFLRLKTLDIAADVLRMVGRSPLDFFELPLDDADTYTMIQDGHVDGVHTLQGKEVRRGVVAMQAENIFDLTLAAALYRPANTRPGKDKLYVKRRYGQEDVEYSHEILERILGPTLGLPIFQEQAMEIGYAVGMDDAGVDDIYQAIKKAKGVGRGAKEAFEEIEPNFMSAAKKSVGEHAPEFWTWVQQFSGYCVTGDTVVERAGAGGTAKSAKITVRDFYDNWNSSLAIGWKYRNKGVGLVSWRDGQITIDQCLGVVFSGRKKVYELVLEDGKTIQASKHHGFWTPDGWRQLRDLQVGDEIVIDTGVVAPYYEPSGTGTGWAGKTKLRAKASDGRMRPSLHGNASALAEVTLRLPGYCENCGRAGVRLERAHLNHDRSDNSRENVKALCNPCHKSHDYATGRRRGRWKRGRLAGVSRVVSVQFIGVRDTFDLVMAGNAHNFVANGMVIGNSFNRAHAASYGVLAGKMAYLKCHYPAEFFAALLDHFPERSQYLAAAREEGYKFMLPDINRSKAGFGIDKGTNSILVGIGKIHGLGPVATNEIIMGQPFESLQNFKEKTSRRSLNVTRIENLAKLGVLEPLGISRAEDEDLIQFQLLGFTLKKPVKFQGIKPKHTGPRESSSGWKHLGRVRGLEPTQGRASVSKLFWIPPGVKLELKASPWANVKTWLFEAVDENGVKFHCLANQDKPDMELLMKFLHKKCQNRVVCLDGMVRLPFVMNGPQGYRLFGVTGSWENDPQVFPAKETDMGYIAAAQSRKLRREN